MNLLDALRIMRAPNYSGYEITLPFGRTIIVTDIFLCDLGLTAEEYVAALFKAAKMGRSPRLKTGPQSESRRA